MPKVFDTLRNLIGDECLLTNADELRVYECDGLPQHRSLPGGVALLNSTDDAPAVVQALSEAGMPFLARGAGTGLSGGALPTNGAFIIELARLNRVLDIDPVNRIARVEVGVLNTEVSRRAHPFGLYYSPDPSSQSACTIGGNIAENAGGIHCLRTGVTVDHVEEIKVVLSDGSVVELHDAGIRPGFDLAGVFVGSEGTFGVATEATLRLLPIPENVVTVLAAFRTIHEGSTAVSDVIASGVLPAALEMMDAVAIRAVEAGVYKAGLPLDAGAALLIEVEGIEETVLAESRLVEAICSRNGAISVTKATDAAERERVWKARKGAFGAMGRLSPDVMIQDAVVPRSRLPEVLDQIHRISSKYRLTVANVFHAGDGNLHPLIPFDSSDADAVKRVRDAGKEMMRVCIDAGGAITGEHGVGIDKIDYLGLTYSADDLEAMQKVRRAFDISGLCNPGKAIPVLRGCGEARAVASQTPVERRAERPRVRSMSTPNGKLRAKLDPFDPGSAIEGLAKIVGSDHVRIDGASVVVEPATAEEVSSCLRLSAAGNWTVAPAGNGIWADAGEWAAPPDMRLSTSRLAGIIRHEPADLVATVGAGTTLAALDHELVGQWLPLDPPFHESSTLGGIVATGVAGPLSATFGRPRSRVLGIKAALADGTIIKAGGSVVKNVAGYDLGKLLTGSYGTLGVILEVSLRLSAKPASDRTLTLGGRAADLVKTALMLRSRGVHASAAAIVSSRFIGERSENSGHVLLLRFIGSEDTVSAEISRARALVDIQDVVEEYDPWSDISTAEEQLMLRVSALASNVGEMTRRIDQELGRGICVDPYQGWIRCLGAEGSIDPSSLEALRIAAENYGGSLIVDRASAALKKKLGVWGRLGSAGRLMARIKSNLDPFDRLAPGRFHLSLG